VPLGIGFAYRSFEKLGELKYKDFSKKVIPFPFILTLDDEDVF